MSDVATRTEKWCPGCKAMKPIDSFGRHARDGYRSRCKVCVKEAEKTGLWSHGTKEAAAAAKKRWRVRYYENNRESILQKAIDWQRNNPQKNLDVRRSYRLRSSEELSDAYVRNRLAERSALSPRDIPQCLVDVKREQLRLLRALKENCDEEC